MSYVNLNEFMKQKPKENFCDVCGRATSQIRTITKPGLGTIDFLSGHTCQECIDLGKEDEYVKNMWDTKIAEDEEYNDLVDQLEKLDIISNGDPDSDDVEMITNRLDELDKNQEARDKLAEKFQNIKLNKKAYFICEHGAGLKQKKCEICGQSYSYLCLVEDYFEGHVETLHEISGYCCADCFNTGIYSTYIGKKFSELVLFSENCENVKKQYEYFESIMGTSQFTEEEEKNFILTFEHGKELEDQEAEYKRKAEKMKKEKLTYMDVPVKTIIKTGKEEDPCYLCGKTLGKGHKCSADKEFIIGFSSVFES